MKPFTAAFLALMLICGFAATGQESGQQDLSVFEAWPSALGYYASEVGGAGLSWQRWYGTIGLAVSAGVEYQPDPEAATSLDYHIQVHAARMIHSYRFSDRISGNLHALATGAYRGSKENMYDPDLETFTPLPLVQNYFLGFGIGIEYVFFGHLSHGYEFVYTGNLTDRTVAIHVGTSLRFRF